MRIVKLILVFPLWFMASLTFIFFPPLPMLPIGLTFILAPIKDYFYPGQDIYQSYTLGLSFLISLIIISIGLMIANEKNKRSGTVRPLF